MGIRLHCVPLHVSALYVGHLQVVIKLAEQLHKMCGVFFLGYWGGGSRERDLVVSIVGSIT